MSKKILQQIWVQCQRPFETQGRQVTLCDVMNDVNVSSKSNQQKNFLLAS